MWWRIVISTNICASLRHRSGPGLMRREVGQPLTMKRSRSSATHSGGGWAKSNSTRIRRSSVLPGAGGRCMKEAVC